MTKFTKEQAIKIHQERKDELQSQLDAGVCLLGDPEEQFAHLRKEIAKCDKKIAALRTHVN